MTATLLPFPQRRRIGAIRRAARYMRTMSPEAREKWFRHRLCQIEQGLDRAGLPQEVVDQEVRSIAQAIAEAFAAEQRGRAS